MPEKCPAIPKGREVAEKEHIRKQISEAHIWSLWLAHSLTE